MKSISSYLLLICALLFPHDLFARGSVSVRGYTRRDGTYVAPHMRSAPNGTKADNWSTKGNVNPYTGQPGTKNVASGGSTGSASWMGSGTRNPPAETSETGAGSSGLTNITDAAAVLPAGQNNRAEAAEPFDWEGYDQTIRKQLADSLKEAGINVDWQKYSQAELRGILSKSKQVAQLRALGEEYSWADYSEPELNEKLERALKIKALEAKGIQLDWTNMSLAQIQDVESRMKQTERLLKLGVRTDWEKSSLAELKGMEKEYYRIRMR